MEILRNGDETLLRTKETESDVNFSRQEVFAARCKMSATMGAFSSLRDSVVSGTSSPVPLRDIEMGTRLLLSVAYVSCHGGVPLNPAVLPMDFRVTGRFRDLYA